MVHRSVFAALTAAFALAFASVDASALTYQVTRLSLNFHSSSGGGLAMVPAGTGTDDIATAFTLAGGDSIELDAFLVGTREYSVSPSDMAPRDFLVAIQISVEETGSVLDGLIVGDSFAIDSDTAVVQFAGPISLEVAEGVTLEVGLSDA